MTSFKEEYSVYEGLEAEILAISSDSLLSHRNFDLRLGGVPFPMLSDEERKVIQAYGVTKDEGKGTQRSVFVLDKEGRIIHANAEFGARELKHYEAIIEALRSV